MTPAGPPRVWPRRNRMPHSMQHARCTKAWMGPAHRSFPFANSNSTLGRPAVQLCCRLARATQGEIDPPCSPRSGQDARLGLPTAHPEMRLQSPNVCCGSLEREHEVQGLGGRGRRRHRRSGAHASRVRFSHVRTPAGALHCWFSQGKPLPAVLAAQ